MTLKQDYFPINKVAGYTSCKYAVYVDPDAAQGDPQKVLDAVLVPVSIVQTSPPFPVNIANILYIPAGTATLKTLPAGSLYRELHLTDKPPVDPSNHVTVDFDQVTPEKPVMVLLKRSGDAFEVSQYDGQ
jgi:hypothetical protein